MKELLRRSLTGVVYVSLLLAAIFLNSDAFDFLFMVFGLGCIYEFKRLLKIRRYYVFVAFLGLWWLYIYFIKSILPVYALLALTLLTNTLLLGYLFSGKHKVFTALQKFLIALFYIGSGCIFLTMIPYRLEGFEKILIMGVFVIIWVNDSFAYLVGKSIGKNKLFPSISPKKTIEGSLGGLIFAVLAGYLISRFDASISTVEWLILAMVLVISGNLGDLLESKFKRSAGVKDSGAILPGHGGILDRLDSLVFAAPFAYATLTIFSYVS